MKPFVAIDGVKQLLRLLLIKVYRCTSIDNCAQTENLYCLFEAVPEPAGIFQADIFLSRTLEPL